MSQGWGVRGFNWEYAASVQHEIMPSVSATVGYYRRWLDMALPALGGKTPRAAVETKAGRARVRELLDELERMDARRPAHAPAVDVGWLRRELGLEE